MIKGKNIKNTCQEHFKNTIFLLVQLVYVSPIFHIMYIGEEHTVHVVQVNNEKKILKKRNF